MSWGVWDVCASWIGRIVVVIELEILISREGEEALIANPIVAPPDQPKLVYFRQSLPSSNSLTSRLKPSLLQLLYTISKPHRNHLQIRSKKMVLLTSSQVSVAISSCIGRSPPYPTIITTNKTNQYSSSPQPSSSPDTSCNNKQSATSAQP